jgi:hypothetical protein
MNSNAQIDISLFSAEYTPVWVWPVLAVISFASVVLLGVVLFLVFRVRNLRTSNRRHESARSRTYFDNTDSPVVQNYDSLQTESNTDISTDMDPKYEELRNADKTASVYDIIQS